MINNKIMEKWMSKSDLNRKYNISVEYENIWINIDGVILVYKLYNGKIK